MQTELMSELDAVNKILAATGDSPVATLDDSYIQSKLAQQELLRASRDIQLKGWWFNEEENVSLNPDTNGFITLAPNVLKVSAVGDGAAIIQRGNKIYNRASRTYVFTDSVLADIIIGLTWDELPQVARTYITDMAALKFNNSFYGAEDTKRILEANLALSEVDMRHADTDARDINLLIQTRVRNIAFKNRRG
jgi:hypothetical protein